MCVLIRLLQTMLQHHSQKLTLVKRKNCAPKFLHKVKLASFFKFLPAIPTGLFVKVFGVTSNACTYRSEMCKSFLIVQRQLQYHNKNILW